MGDQLPGRVRELLPQGADGLRGRRPIVGSPKLAGGVAKLLVAGNANPLVVRKCREIEAGAAFGAWMATV